VALEVLRSNPETRRINVQAFAGSKLRERSSHDSRIPFLTQKQSTPERERQEKSKIEHLSNPLIQHCRKPMSQGFKIRDWTIWTLRRAHTAGRGKPLLPGQKESFWSEATHICHSATWAMRNPRHQAPRSSGCKEGSSRTKPS